MATLLSITNKVLRRLREDAVAATTDRAYSGLVAEFVSDIHMEVVDEHDWEFFKHRVEVDVVASQRRYDLSATIANGGSVRDSINKLARYDSSLRFDANHSPLAFYFRTASGPYGWQMWQVSDDDRRRLFAQNTDIEQDWPTYYSLTNDGSKLYLDFAWAPLDDDAHFELDLITQPPTLESDGTDDATEILIPERVIYLGALYLAQNERGEEIGEPGHIAEMRYREALAAAIEKDHKHNEVTDQYDWSRQ